MKKTNFLWMAFLLVAVITYFSGCSDSTDPNPIVAGALKITVTEQTGATYAPGTSVTYQVEITSNEKLKTLVISPILDNVAQAAETKDLGNLKSASYTYIFQIPAGTANGAKASITFEATDAATTQKQIMTLTVGAAPAGLDSYSAKLLGDFKNNTAGSFFSSIDGTVYMESQAKDNSAKVDFLYFYGATNKATIAAPSDATAATIFNNASNGLQAWATKNATKFATSSLNFEAASEADIVTAAKATSNTLVNQLSASSVFVFMTARGAAGIVKVKEVKFTALESADNYIIIDVKVQKK